MTLYEWLIEQAERGDIVGDLAYDTVRKVKEPGNLVPVDSNSRKEWFQYLSSKGDHVAEAFKEAWSEYSSQ